MIRYTAFGLALVASVILCACGGGGGSSSNPGFVKVIAVRDQNLIIVLACYILNGTRQRVIETIRQVGDEQGNGLCALCTQAARHRVWAIA